MLRWTAGEMYLKSYSCTIIKCLLMLSNNQLWCTVTLTSEVLSWGILLVFRQWSKCDGRKSDLISLTLFLLFIHTQLDAVCARCLWKSLKHRLTAWLLWFRLQGARSGNNCFKIAVISPDCPTKLAKRLVSRDPDNASESSSLHLSIRCQMKSWRDPASLTVILL